MAARMRGVNDQALNHFVTNSPWPTDPVMARLAQRIAEVITPAAWAIDDTGFCKDGDASVCVWPQYTGTAGKVTNCQVGASVNLVTGTASCPVNWRLFLPEALDPRSPEAMADVWVKRRKTAIPRHGGSSGEVAPGVGHARPDDRLGAAAAAGRRRRRLRR
jgi:SRSO17 transposase